MNATIFGRVGRDAELKQTQGGTTLARFSVALNVYSKQEQQTTWVNATLFGKMAESLAQYLTKGTAVALSGDLKLRQYTSEQNGEQTTLDMSVNSVALLGGGQAQSQSQPQGKQVRPAQNRQTQPASPRGGYRPPQAQAVPQSSDNPGWETADDSDIPF